MYNFVTESSSPVITKKLEKSFSDTVRSEVVEIVATVEIRVEGRIMSVTEILINLWVELAKGSAKSSSTRNHGSFVSDSYQRVFQEIHMAHIWLLQSDKTQAQTFIDLRRLVVTGPLREKPKSNLALI